MSALAGLRCAVLGGGGFMGTNLCRHLAGRVQHVRAFGRRQAFPAELADIEWFPGDFNDANVLPAAVAGCDIVFHLVSASTPGSANVDKVADLQTSVVPTLHLLEACRAEGVRRVVFVSSGGTIYGIPQAVPTPEDAATSPITAYGISKLAIEKYLGLYEYMHGLEYRVLRVANPFGPFQTALKNQGVIAAFVARAMAGQPVEVWGDGTVTRDYVYIEDVCAAFAAAAHHAGPGRIFNIGSGEGRSLNDIVAALEAELGAGLQVTRRAARRVDVPVSVLDISAAARELQWTPQTPFREGLARTIAWMRTRTRAR